MAAKVKVTLVRSVIGRPEKQRRVVKSLGLGKIGSSSIVENVPTMAGQIRKVQHLIKVEEVEI
ncbi:50S ribosomal protein L30 [Desulfurispirillum indicum]|uniref:50S ribosomal protein L30 n=1 Tax=Desulfurispirillum indicum (strain ATCC BAA-1389 / DSM 22839 / S5) TaxID=653733 RepID=E6W728_DESIS|nr:50S ribosomal protein L30 [Desulfurispirillum indicum]ADU65106.1 ribosomal protein L30 [Desulfurispirillum indicum S5]UCZ57009.1 50S ribosomal protein L30 [Desulfurispirillum indicum]